MNCDHKKTVLVQPGVRGKPNPKAPIAEICRGCGAVRLDTREGPIPGNAPKLNAAQARRFAWAEGASLTIVAEYR